MSSQVVDTVESAIELLNAMDVEVIGITRGWILHFTRPEENDFELTCDTDAELIHYARSEHNLCLRLCRQLGFESWQELISLDSYSSAADGFPREAWPSEELPAPVEESAREVEP